MLAKCVAPATLALIAFLPGASLAASDARLADAAARGDRAAVRALIDQRVDVNAKGVDGTTALHQAVLADRLDITEMLLV